MTDAREAALARRRRGISIVPAPLGALLIAVALLGVAWALIVPPWQSPDEPQHFAYAQSLAERFALPPSGPNVPVPGGRPAASAAQSLADGAVGASREAFYPGAVPPDWSAADFAGYLAAVRHDPSPSNGGGQSSAGANPPLFYLYSDLAYWAADAGSDAFSQLYAMRIWGVLLLLVTTLGGWLLAGEVLGPRRDAQLACAAATGLVPAATFISTSVNPDALMVALWTVALWLGARVIIRRGPRAESVIVGLVTAAAVLTKATSYALVPAVLLAMVLGWRRQPSGERRSVAAQFLAPVAALALPVLGWLSLSAALGRAAVNKIPSAPRTHPFSIPQFLSYLWQFYLPRLPFMSTFRETAGLPLYDLWIREGWGVFGWRNVAMPGFVYAILAAVSGAIAIAAAAVLVRIRDRLRLELLAFFGLALLALLAGLHVSDYRTIIAGQAALIQGRYLLPVVSLLGLTIGLLVARAPRRWRGAACGTVVAGMLLLQVLALATIAGGYYT